MSSLAPLPVEIHRSAQNGELQKVIKWLRKGGLTDALYSFLTHDNRSSTATLLHTAATNGRLEMVKVLLKRKTSVNLPTSFGFTALMSAAYYGHSSTLLILLEYSANPDLQDSDGHTALMLAAGLGQEQCVQTLLRAKANPDLHDIHGQFALMRATLEGQEKRVQALLRAKANTELFDENGHAALQWFEAQGYTSIAALNPHGRLHVLGSEQLPRPSGGTGGRRRRRVVEAPLAPGVPSACLGDRR